MNCAEFETVVGELADASLMEASSREAGLGHASACVGCAARLMELRGAGAALRVASKAETEEAPARVKRHLLAAFEERRRTAEAQAFSNTLTDAPVNVETRGAVNVKDFRQRRASRWWLAASAAAAAVLLLSLGLSSSWRASRDAAITSPPDVRAKVDAREARKPTEAKPDEGVPGAAQKSSTDYAPPVAAKNDEKRARRTSAVVRPRAEAKEANEAKEASAGQTASRAVAREDAGDYLPLTYLDGSTAMESGTVVRVELSRSALVSLGVPVTAEGSDELLKADVVLGDDGLARAIRLVR